MNKIDQQADLSRWESTQCNLQIKLIYVSYCYAIDLLR